VGVAGDGCDEGVVAARSERKREALEVGDGHVLVGERDHAVREPGVADRVDRSRIERRGQVDAGDARTAGRPAGFDVDHAQRLRWGPFGRSMLRTGSGRSRSVDSSRWR
jgi:hypothetical protein